MNEDRCMCACHLLDHDGVLRAFMVAWRCTDCGAEPLPDDEPPSIRRHVAENGRVTMRDTHGLEGDIEDFVDAYRRRMAPDG